MKSILLIIIYIVIAWDISAQDTSKAKQLVVKGNVAIEAGKLENAHNLLTEASLIFEQANDWDNYIACGRLLTGNLIQAGEYQMGLDIGQKHLDLAKEKGQKSIDLSLLNKNMGTIHYLNYDYKKALPYLEEALKIRESLNAKDPELARDYGNVGIISRFSNRYNKAIEYVEKAISLQEDNNVLARLYNELGVNYRLLGDFRKSLDQQNQAIRLLEASENKEGLANAYMEKGASLTELKREGNNVVFIKKALKMFEEPSVLDYTNQLLCYKLIGDSYFLFEGTIDESKGALDTALNNYMRALDIATNNLPDGNALAAQLMQDVSSVLTKKDDFDNAEKYLNSSEGLLEGNIEPVSIEAADFFKIKADFFLFQGKYEEALSNFQEQINALLPDYNNSDIYSLPSEKEAKQSLSADKLQHALAAKARCWNLYFQYKKQDKKYLEEGLKSIRLFDFLINHMRVDFSRSGSNIAWSDLTLDAYESAIRICLALAKETGDENYKKQALFYSEKSKALSLLESFQNTKARTVAGLSEEILKQERELKLDISDLNKSIFQIEQKKSIQHKEELVKLKKQLFEKEKTYSNFIKNLEENNPKYYSTKYELNILGLDEMRALLKQDQGIIEYFVGDSAIYAFKITEKDFEVFQLGGEESILYRVKDLRNSVYGFFLANKDKSDQMKSRYIQQYTQRAYKMYQELVEPLGVLAKRLIIIPAGPLCDMPFELILKEKTEKDSKLRTFPYLVKDHAFSYSYSATLLSEMINKPHVETKGIYAGFAPTFGDHKPAVVRGELFKLSPLVYNLPEVEEIQKILGTGEIFEGKEATEDKFKDLASDYEILHLATHGMANSNDPDFSLLAFTEVHDDLENEFLYVSDLYNLEINAEMVVLSACETALGKNFRGEGIMSMARGFSFAGAKSIFTTLWSVNDRSTFDIIKRFYFHLQNGMDKDLALQQAKLDYLGKAIDLAAHPFLWSPYIMIGDTSSINDIVIDNTFYYLGFCLLIMALGLVFMKFLRRK